MKRDNQHNRRRPIEDQPKSRRWSHLSTFEQEVARQESTQRCGGGRRIIRKKIGSN